MSKYKVCPDCGFHNEPFRIECARCEADITASPVVDGTSEAREQPVPAKKLARICECGAVNPPAARKCAQCGEDISDIVPAPEPEKAAAPRFTLAAVDGSYAYELTQSETTVGREQEMSGYLSQKQYVSRTHAKFTVLDGRLFVSDCGSVNHTYINSARISTSPQELHDGDEVGLGGCVADGSRQEGAAYFTVRICS